MRYIKKLLTFLLAVAIVPTTVLAADSDFPNKPVKIMVGMAAGGGTDLAARGLASFINNSPAMRGMPAVVINQPGASGMLAARTVQNEKADGYTLYMSNIATFGANAILSQIKDNNNNTPSPRSFHNLGCFSQMITALQVPADHPAKNAAEWVELVKKENKQVVWSAAGSITLHSILGRKFLNDLGIPYKIVPFKGGSPARAAIISKSVDASFNGVHNNIGFFTDMKSLGVASLQRDTVKSLKKIPTFKEQGLPELGVTGLLCLWGPKDMPADITAALEQAVADTAATPGLEKYLAKSGLGAFYLNPVQAVEATNKTFDIFEPIIKDIVNNQKE